MAKLAHKTKLKFKYESRLTPLDPAIARHTSIDPDSRGVYYLWPRSERGRPASV
jgi:hypothetical protein